MNRAAESETREQQREHSQPQQCTHGPNTRCLRCMGRDTASAAAPKKKKKVAAAAASAPNKCNHDPGVFCINCMPASARAAAKEGARVPASVLCNHGPGVFCVNCMPQPDRAAGAAAETPAITTDPLVGRRLTAQCTHDATMFCEHCLPPPPPVDPYTLPATAQDLNDEDPPERRCVHHGPHGSCLECMAVRESRKMVMRRQERPRAGRLRIDRAALDNFQSFVRQHKTGAAAPPFRRMAWLLGTADAAAGVTTVHALYEPVQTWPASFAAQRDAVPALGATDDAAALDAAAAAVCAALGLAVVGWAFSHDARREVLTAREVERMAAWQKQYGPGFVTLALRCTYSSSSGGGGGGGGGKGQCVINAEAYQVSDQGVELYARHNLDYDGGIAVSPTALRLRRCVVSEKRDTKALDVAWLIVPVPVVAHASTLFRTAHFPAPARPGTRITGSHVLAHLRDARDRAANPFADFDFLLYVATLPAFSRDTDLPVMCASLTTHRDVSGYIEMLTVLAEQL